MDKTLVAENAGRRLTAAWAVGLESPTYVEPSRLRGQFVQLFLATPGEREEAMGGLAERFARER